MLRSSEIGPRLRTHAEAQIESWTNKERIYIVPTWYGLAYVLGLVAVFFQAALVNNQLVYLLGFCLVTFFLVGMFQTNSNLKGIELGEIGALPGPAEGHASFRVSIFNLGSQPRFALGVQFVVGENRVRSALPLLPRDTTEPLELTFPVGPRGRFPIPRLRIYTVFPLGLFYAWKWKIPTAEYFVYPKPEGTFALGAGPVGSSDKGTGWQAHGDDFSGHRPYQKGDSQRLIDWKARARKLPWLVKQFNEGEGGSQRLRWEDLASLDTEDRLSQLSLWVHECQKRGESYSLELPQRRLELGTGHRHFLDCLEALAGHPADGDAGADPKSETRERS